MTRIDIYSGFLGAGKTTLIKKMIKEAYSGEKRLTNDGRYDKIISGFGASIRRDVRAV